jgi:benzoyl-CoA reductase subunit C
MEAPLNAVAPTAREALVARAEELYRDTSFSAVRRWKERNPGGKAIGYLPIYVPLEAIRAAGMLPVGIVGGGDMEVVRGDACYQSYICRIPRSTIELGLTGALDCVDGFVFPSTCDVIRNLSGMWRILFPGRYVKYLDLPQNFDPATGGAFFAHELRKFAADLVLLGGRPTTDASLREAIAVYNENRAATADLHRLRAEEPWRAPASEVYLIMRAGLVLPAEEHTELVRAYAAAARADDRRPQDTARVAVRGCFCEQPPLELLRTLERAGCSIVDDDWLMALRWFDGPLPLDGDPLRNLVDAFLKRSPACPSLYLERGKKGDALLERARETRAEGVVFAAPSFCDPALLDQPMLLSAVKRADIPCTAFLYSENTGQFQVIREQAGAFADSIRLA